MAVDEWNENEESGNEAPVTDEEREVLRTLRETGMSTTEVVSRARRDYETEMADGAQAADQTRPVPAPAAPVEDGESLVSKQELHSMLEQERAKVRQEAEQAGRVGAMAATQSAALHQTVEKQIADKLGDIPRYKVDAVKAEVNRRMSGNVKTFSLPQAEFDREVVKVTRQICEEERDAAHAISKGERSADLDSRLSAHASAPGGGRAGGGGGKRSVAAKSDHAKRSDALDDPPYGLLSESKEWPSEREIRAAHDDELEEFERTAASGRG